MNKFYSAINIKDESELKTFAKVSGVKLTKLKYYSKEMIYPHKEDLKKILLATEQSEIEFKLKLGIVDNKIKEFLANHSSEISKFFKQEPPKTELVEIEPVFQTEKGKLFQSDCIPLMRSLPNESVDLIFADPPFNLNKSYESGVNDKLSKEEYLQWTEDWVMECVNLLKEGGSLFIWNLPVWNTYIAEILNKHLTLRHWIAADVKYSLPIQNKLYPSHYALLYYTKGEKPNVFNTERRPLEVCRHCGGDIRDYGGYKDKLNPMGINLTDVWYDISPVRHSKYKTRTSNELPLKLLERVITLATNEGDTVFDPFGGSGTTYIVSEILKRKWIGCEIGPIETIKERFNDIEFHKGVLDNIDDSKNILFSDATKKLRKKNNHWLPETLKINNKEPRENLPTQVELFPKA
ncbi:site-specific DNA-methyltransferase [Paenibacillus barcinonensis]|uniref:DNA-methyltransferase n=1 Tax=Paenibacillus barcinonensis TaxID=198119 RepID=UPI001C12083C|nr:site-specific DNA-methyltransferase [Paenibacillus barcinonensis]MBU5353182.1 site-specific DNA-methyltransferase [Paenibacillus barcinonensis]